MHWWAWVLIGALFWGWVMGMIFVLALSFVGAGERTPWYEIVFWPLGFMGFFDRGGP